MKYANDLGFWRGGDEPPLASRATEGIRILASSHHGRGKVSRYWIPIRTGRGMLGMGGRGPGEMGEGAEDDANRGLGLGREVAGGQLVGLEFPDQGMVEVIETEFGLDGGLEF